MNKLYDIYFVVEPVLFAGGLPFLKKIRIGIKT